MDFYDRTAGYIEWIAIEGRRTLREYHSKEIWEKFPNFCTLYDLWDEADIWDCPMDLTLLPLKDMDIKGLRSLHSSLLRVLTKYEKKGIPLHEVEHKQAYHSLILVEQWIYYRKIIVPKKRSNSEKPEKYYRSLAVQEREFRKKQCRNGLDDRKYFGLFWRFFCYIDF